MTDAGRILGRGLAFPPHVGADGRVAFSEGEQNIRESIRTVLQTELEERLRLPEFGAGLGQLLFEPNTTATRRQVRDRISLALASWEPRIAVQGIDVAEDADDPQAAVATIAYRLVASQALERVTLSIPLAG
jgi:Bacteriophage baseplate protein W